MTDPLTYAAAGVDIDAGNRLVDRIRRAVAATKRPGADGSLGGFGGLFDLKAAGFKDPVLVAATDGVGTKLDLAVALDRHDSIGIDLVAMCVNDLIVQGAEPLLFLDYFATGRLSVDTAEAVVTGIAKACEQVGAALLGGETAEMPGLYQDGHYDLAGFAVGAAERGTLLPKTDLAPGDVLLGLGSSGAHSNGFSLIRQLVAKQGLQWDDAAPFADGQSLGEALLTPTRLYVRPLLPEIRAGRIKALAHITGGGLVENVPRVLPDGLMADIRADAWTLPPLFRWIAETGPVTPAELLRTFNCGIGMVAVVAEDDVPSVEDALRKAGEEVGQIGRLQVSVDGVRCRVQCQDSHPWGPLAPFTIRHPGPVT